jgi:hypothetical protein
MAKDYLMLSDLVGRTDFLELLCGRCERRGRLSVARLAREYPRKHRLPRSFGRRSAIARSGLIGGLKAAQG